MEENETESSEENGTSLHDIVIAGCYVVAIGLEAYMLLDRLTDGEFSQTCSIKFAHLRARIRRFFDIERRIQKETGAVIWEAQQVIENAR